MIKINIPFIVQPYDLENFFQYFRVAFLLMNYLARSNGLAGRTWPRGRELPTPALNHWLWQNLCSRTRSSLKLLIIIITESCLWNWTKEGWPNKLRFLAYWYTQQVKWGTSISAHFGVSNAIRQGGVLFKVVLFFFFSYILLICLNNWNPGSRIGDTLVKHPMHADDLGP